ncbi:nucleoside diphosphate kinase, partial [Sistotremastrum niveocremeum HHB9708]
NYPEAHKTLTLTMSYPLRPGSEPLVPKTRTLAIIKPHAIKHRLTIERRILDAGFEVIKERKMAFDPDGDRDYMEELFGRDADALVEESVWVYVLERRMAVETWKELMGDEDPVVAQEKSPSSLRALYGMSRELNGFIGSQDEETAEAQISALFASSPPFPPTEYDGGSLRSIASSMLAALAGAGGVGQAEQERGVDDPEKESSGRVASDGGSTVGGEGKRTGFKARKVPGSTHVATIQPRTTRTAAMRAGMAVETKRRVPATRESIAKTFANVPGHKRKSEITVASTAAPRIVPRMTRAASLRIGGGKAAPKSERKAGPPSFDGVPGHKRRESIAVASTRAPAVAPRTNRSAELRAKSACHQYFFIRCRK